MPASVERPLNQISIVATPSHASSTSSAYAVDNQVQAMVVRWPGLAVALPEALQAGSRPPRKRSYRAASRAISAAGTDGRAAARASCGPRITRVDGR